MTCGWGEDQRLPCGDVVRDGSLSDVNQPDWVSSSFHLCLFLGLSSNIEKALSAVFVPLWFTIDPTSLPTLSHSSPIPALRFLTLSVCRYGRHGSLQLHR